MKRLLTTVLLGLFTVGLIAPQASADELDDLKKRFNERYKELLRIKGEGTIGENYKGLIEERGSLTGADAKLVEAENTDRKRLYELIGKRQNVPAEVVAKQAALRNFSIAKKGHWLKGQDEKWTQKS